MKKDVLRVFRVMVLIVVFFVTSSVNQSKADISQKEALIDAAQDGNIERVKSLIAAGADVNAQDEDGYTALMYAAVNDQTETVKLLIAAGAEVNVQAKDGATALMVAVNRGHTKIIHLLKAAGAK